MDEKKYTLRELQAKDVFPATKIISKIGIKEFKRCFEAEDVKSAISNMATNPKADLASVGVAVVLDIADVIISNISSAEQDIYQFLSNLSGMTKKEIESLDISTFVEMIMDVFKKENFKDFTSVVSKLLK